MAEHSTSEGILTETRSYKVAGLACSDCAMSIQVQVGALEGVRSCAVDPATGFLTVQLEVPDFDLEPVARIVRETGHELVIERVRSQRPERHAFTAFIGFLFSRTDTLLMTVAGGLTFIGLALSLFRIPALAITAVFALAILVGGIPVFRHALNEVLRARMLGINTLMVIAVTGAMFIGEWSEAAIVVVLFALGEALESYAAERARGALESLLDLAPPVALVLQSDGTPLTRRVETIAIGERVLVRPGRSAVDQAAITGESIPVDKGIGDEVFAGTVNTFGALEVEVTRRAVDNTLSRMVALVQEAQSRQAPVQRFVDRFARVYTPAVTASALLIAVLPPLLWGQPFLGPTGWLMRALQLLVIACPCALVISTPVSVVSALTHAARRGVLIKGGGTLEALGRVTTFAFDKTGTLTEGKPVATDILSVCEDTGCRRNGLQLAAAVESQSSHPLARALVAEAQTQALTLLPAHDVAILEGQGMTGVVNGERVTVASHPYFDARVPHSEAVCREAERLAAAGRTVMLVCHDEQICSVFAVADTPRATSAEVLTDLKALGGLRTVMLTGDGAAVAQTIAHTVGVDEVRAGLLPEGKVAAVRELQRAVENDSSTAVAFVGDGVNDAPALAQADVGIAMGGAGSHQALEVADVVLMGDDLRHLPFIVRLSRRARQTVRANIIFALAVKAVVFGLALAGAGSLWLAIVADVGASLIVILNGMRLRGVTG
ncbi:MAG: putative cadmium-transporting ATPase [Chloroflexi bacterium ADurb.Bin360]|nr:MAG: putative cadmium-transporting ATPase [Chloroflexi bacterium ADurb.Bin360]